MPVLEREEQISPTVAFCLMLGWNKPKRNDGFLLGMLPHRLDKVSPCSRSGRWRNVTAFCTQTQREDESLPTRVLWEPREHHLQGITGKGSACRRRGGCCSLRRAEDGSRPRFRCRLKHLLLRVHPRSGQPFLPGREGRTAGSAA